MFFAFNQRLLDLVGLTVGNLAAAVFVYAIAVALFLAILAQLEQFPGIRNMRLFSTLRPPGSWIDRFLARNAAINEAASVIVVGVLLGLAVVKPAIDELKGFLDWVETQPLLGRTFLIVLSLYLLLGTIVTLVEFARNQAGHLVTRAARRIEDAFEKRERRPRN